MIPSHPEVTIRTASLDDLDAVTALHRAALDYSFNSRLGRTHLEFTYRCLLDHPDSLLACAWADGKLVGTVSATLALDDLKRAIYAALPLAGWARIGLRILTRPALWPLAWNAVWEPSAAEWQGRPLRPCLTAIAVAEGARRMGVGQALVNAVDEFIRWHGLSAYWLETERDNSGAQAFYERMGFVQVGKHGSALFLVKPLSTPFESWSGTGGA